MTLQEFTGRIMATPCEKCPIEIYCQLCTAFSCHSTARQYYASHKRQEEEFRWPDKTCTTTRTNIIIPKH